MSYLKNKQEEEYDNIQRVFYINVTGDTVGIYLFKNLLLDYVAWIMTKR